MRTWMAILVVFATTACSVGPNADFIEPQAERDASLRTATPTGQAVLRLLNHRSTTFSVLDELVGLDRRAATHLVVYRDGADGICGTADDRRFQSIEQVDAVKYIGTGALDRLATHAHQHGWVVDEGALYGDFMGIAFTVGEARHALALVNRESAEDLEITMGLGLDVVEALIELRPFADLADVAHVSEVGAEDLERLKRW